MKHLKKYLFNTLILVYIISILYHSLVNTSIFFDSLFSTLDIWLYKIFPSIFIFYLTSALLLSTSLLKYLFFILKPLQKIIKFETINAFYLFIISILVGNPTSSNYLIKYLDENKITKKDALLLSQCASFITPLFIFSIFNNQLLSIIIYLSHIISNIIIAIMITRNNNYIKKESNTFSYRINFLSSLTSLPRIIFIIAIMMIFCNTISFCLSSINTPYYITFVIELGNGIYLLKDQSNSLSMLLIVFLISFNGFSIHLQVYSSFQSLQNKMVENNITNSLYKKYLKGRITQALLSVLIFIILKMLIYTYFA